MTNPTQSADLEAVRRAVSDRYVIERELGRGGMGTVYLARDIKLDRPVALKVLPEQFASQVALRDRFLQETKTTAKFSHPNIVPVYSVEDAGELLAYAMGFIEGETLAERVTRMGPLPSRDIVRVLQDVGYALAYAHGRGVVHRDIKPDNIMIERATGRALVMDFGISRSMAHAVPAAALTRVGEVVGTPEYMSPEQASGDVVDGRSDLYSLGLVAHFAASAKTAVTAESTQKVLVKQLTEAVPSLALARPDLPAALVAAVDRCVRKDPAERFTTAEGLVEAIDAAQLAAPEIPVPIRLFAGDLSILSLISIGILFYSLMFIASSTLTIFDKLLPIVGLGAVLITRAMTSVSEGRRIAAAGFSPDDVITGFGRVIAEKADRREALRVDPDTRARRKETLRMAAVLLPLAIVMVVIAWFSRVEYAPHMYGTPTYGIILIFSGTALLGVCLVLLVRSPFRAPVGERLFRAVWMGPFGRAFVRFAVRARSKAARTPAAAQVSAPPRSQKERLADLEQRVNALEHWKRTR